ncbi:MAG: SH3 domain-containing protein [Lachnospiraceae bacterium]|nr:SH3 domain-containing protein [Lachnospiraceae bacterium]
MGYIKKKKNNPLLQFVKDHKTVTAVIAAAVVVLGLAAVLLICLFGKKEQPVTEPETETVVEETAAGQEEENGLVPLELDAYPEVNDLMKRYYAAVTAGDREQIKSMSDVEDESALLYLELRSVFIEAYNDLQCYTKVGPAENSYVVYVAYNVKFNGIERQVPGVSPFLIYTRQDGSLYIHEGEVSDEVNDYLEQISVQDDVVDLMNRVQVEFNETILNDEGMNNFLAEMKEELQIAMGEALAEVEAAQEAAEQAAANPAVIFEAGSKVKATAVVNVRSSDSEQADKLGKLQTGDVVTVVESKANGWTKFTFDGKDAFVKTEFLEAAADGETDTAQQSQEEDTESDLPGTGTIKVGATVNIRKSASETADKIAVCYQGEKLEILMKQADGWTKVKFKGKTGYVKTSVLEVLD